MKKILVLTFIVCIIISLTSCRKSPRNRDRNMRNHTEISDREKTRDKRKYHKPLSGSEIFKIYGNSVFMIFTSDGLNRYQGSGFFIGQNGLAVSNYHVFEGTTKGEEYIKLPNDNNSLYKVSEVLYRSKEPDFIVFRVDYENSTFIPVADKKPAIGDKVFAIGSPRGLENTFSSGEISQWRGDYLIQINALIDHGSSGGALLNEYGEAVGITSGSFYDGSQANLNYAWSIEVIKPYI